MGAFNRRNKRVSNGNVTHLRPFRHNQLRNDATYDEAEEHDIEYVRPRRRGIYLLPNAFTTAALFAGFFAIMQAMNMRFDVAAIAIFAAMVLDGMDGRVARAATIGSASPRALPARSRPSSRSVRGEARLSHAARPTRSAFLPALPAAPA